MENEEKRERLLEAAIAILGNSPDGAMQIVSLNKSLFYLDLAMLRDFGEVFTHNTYVALGQGPVVAHYAKRLVKPLEKLGFAKQHTSGESKPVALVPDLPPPSRYLTAECAAKAKAVAGHFSAQTSSKASEFSHENSGWISAYRKGLGKGQKPAPINMLIAMQQITDGDPWLLEQISEEQRDSLELLDLAQGEPW